jgi:hypothetical protein
VDISGEAELRLLANRFLAEAFEALSRDRVVPTSRFNPHIRVGHEYFGDAVRSVPTYASLETAITNSFPERFGERGPGELRDFASAYLFSLVEAAVFRCSVADGSFNPESSAVAESLDEMMAVLATPTTGVAAARIVTHMTTTAGAPLELGDVVIQPGGGWDGLRLIGELIPGTGGAVSRDPPFVHCPPESVIHIRGDAAGSPYDAVEQLSSRIEKFLLAVRLLTGATVQSGFEIRGSTSRVSRMSPYMVQFQMGGLADTMIRRTARLDEHHGEPIRGLLTLLRESGGSRDGKPISSLDMSLRLFNRSYQHAPWFDRLVDLTTALEAALVGVGDDNAGLSLRLRSRAATLLAVNADPAEAIFRDIGTLYQLRSRLVHGGDVKDSDLTKWLQKLSTMPPDEMRGVAPERGVDRLRDLVRRAVLARMALGHGDEPLWPWGKGANVDAVTSDDEERKRWRACWRDVIAGLGLSSAADPAPRAVDALSRDDR